MGRRMDEERKRVGKMEEKVEEKTGNASRKKRKNLL
jgi:hypothetical protein